jgi:glycosyltransferase involved in cell wall biosynthesis
MGMYGAENVLLSLSKEMKNSRFKPIIGVFENSQNPHTEIAAEAEKIGIQTVIFPCRGRLDIRTIGLIRNYISKHQVQILHSHGYKSNVYGLLSTLWTRTRKVTTCHNWTKTTRDLRTYSLIDKYFLRHFDCIVTVSDELKAELVKRGVSGNKVMTIHNGVSVEKFKVGADQGELKREFGFPAHYKVVGTVGRLSPEKGLDIFIRAAGSVLKEFPETAFLIVGDGPMKESLSKLIGTMGIGKNVILTGLRNDVERIYSVLDIFVLSSLNEGLPMVLLEAMAARRPVISTRVGAIAEVVLHGETGLLIQNADSQVLAQTIGFMLKNEDEAGRLAANGYRRVCKDYSAKRMAEQYLSMYDKMVVGDQSSGERLSL